LSERSQAWTPHASVRSQRIPLTRVTNAFSKKLDNLKAACAPPVYNAACYVAAGLMANSFPAPRIFTHGPKSVVFNWSNEVDNLYLTISADKISALISSPERIKRRIDYSANELMNPSLALSSIRAAYSEKPVEVTGAVFDLPEPELVLVG